jgi:hypothetical protein
MTARRSLEVSLAYACISGVYLLYLLHALPVLDDWVYLQLFQKAAAGGIGGVSSFLRSLVENQYTGHFRMNWAGYLPAFLLYFAAGLSPWAYALLAWLAHLATGVLLYRLVFALTGREEAGFLSGATYVVFPACNNILFLFLSSSYYYFQSLALVWWLWRMQGRDYGFRFADLPLLALVVYSGEQIQPALLLLPLLTGFLFRGRPNWRGWLLHAAAISALAGFYYFGVNRYAITRGLEGQPGGRLQPVNFFLFGSLGLDPAFAEWRPAWALHGTLAVAAALGLGGCLWGRRRCTASAGARDRTGELLLWSVAGVILTYLPVARLSSFEWRYLYVPSLFLVPAGIAVLTLLPRVVRGPLAAVVVLYSISYTWFEMRQCWIPQSRLAHAQMDAVAAHRPYRAEDIVILSGSPLRNGTAPDFITGASWSMRAVLALYGGTEGVLAGRELVAGDRGELAVFQGDAYVLLRSEDLRRVRYFALDSQGRFVPQATPPPRPASSHEIQLRLRSGP